MNRNNLIFCIALITAIAFTACNRGAGSGALDSASQSGDLELYMTGSHNSPDNPQELRIGSSVSGNLDYNEKIWFSVMTTQSGFLTVRAVSDIDTYLETYDTQNNFIAGNDDWDGLNPRIEFMAEANTVYLFQLAGYSGETSGPFNITASHRPRPSLTELRSGSINGFIESGQEYWFRVPVSQAGILNIHTTGDTDTILEAYSRNFEFLTGDNSSGDYYNAMIVMNVRAGETYLFRLTAFEDSSGPYTLAANVDAYPAPAELTHGSFLDRYIEAGDEHWYSVRVTEGEILTVWTEGATDTTLEALTDTYESIAYHDDTWYGELVDRNARISIEIYNVAAGTLYIFRLRSFGSGPYRIFVDMGYAQG